MKQAGSREPRCAQPLRTARKTPGTQAPLVLGVATPGVHPVRRDEVMFARQVGLACVHPMAACARFDLSCSSRSTVSSSVVASAVSATC
jgi:hypothetical protein